MNSSHRSTKNLVTPKTRANSNNNSNGKILRISLDPLKTSRNDFDTRLSTQVPDMSVTRHLHRKTQSYVIFPRKSSRVQYPPVVQQLQAIYSAAFKRRNLPEAIDTLIDVMMIAICRDSILGLLNTYILVGETYTKFCDFPAAINVYMQILHICDVCHGVPDVRNTVMKKVFQKLAQLAHLLKHYDVATQLFKKLLQFAWYNSDKQLELLCFDKLGQLAYLSAEIEKAQFYHQRAIWGRTEPITTSHYTLSTHHFDAYFKKLPKSLVHIDAHMMNKAAFLPLIFVQSSQPSEHGIEVLNSYMRANPRLKLIKQPHRFTNLLSVQQTFAKLLDLAIFEYEVPTPRQSNYDQDNAHDLDKLSPTDLFINSLKQSTKREDKLYLSKLLVTTRSQGGFVIPQTRTHKKKLQHEFDKDILKQPLDQQVSERIAKAQSFAYQIDEKYKVSNMNYQRVPMRDQVRVSHLSPNRDLFAYNESWAAVADPDKLFVINVLF